MSNSSLADGSSGNESVREEEENAEPNLLLYPHIEEQERDEDERLLVPDE